MGRKLKNFLEGMGSVLVLMPPRKRHNIVVLSDAEAMRVDGEALRSDVEAVGNDFRMAFEAHRRGEIDVKTKVSC